MKNVIVPGLTPASGPISTTGVSFTNATDSVLDNLRLSIPLNTVVIVNDAETLGSLR